MKNVIYIHIRKQKQTKKKKKNQSAYILISTHINTANTYISNIYIPPHIPGGEETNDNTGLVAELVVINNTDPDTLNVESV
jgi:hypothetical protein